MPISSKGTLAHKYCEYSFLPWNLPYEALIGKRAALSDHASPLGSSPAAATPPNMIVHPKGPAGSPIGDAVGPSPTSQLVQRKVLLDRANMFLSGRHTDLLKQVSPAERR